MSGKSPCERGHRFLAPSAQRLQYRGRSIGGCQLPGMPSLRQHALFRHSALLILCAGLTIAAAAAPSTPTPVEGPVRAQHLTVELLPLEGSIQPGGQAQIGLHFTLDKGWHVYWVNAGDSGEPPSIKWTLPAGITAGPMQFPAPRRLPLGPLMDFGYEDEVLFPITLSADSTLKAPSTAQLSAHVNWLVCREVCIPGKADLAVPLQVVSAQGPADPGRQALFDRFRGRLPQPLPSSSHAVFGTTPSGFALALTGHPSTTCRVFSPRANADRERRAATRPRGGWRPGDLSQEGRELPYAAGAIERGVAAGRRNSLRDSRSSRLVTRCERRSSGWRHTQTAALYRFCFSWRRDS